MSGASRWLDALAPLGPRSAAPVARASPSAASAALVRRTLVVRMCFPSLGGTVLAWVRPCRSGGWAAVRFRSLTHPRRGLVRTHQLVTTAPGDSGAHVNITKGVAAQRAV